MGFFSWKTQDTNESIANQFSSRPVFTVTMTDNKGNSWTERNYEGYGVFGGKDYYELLAEMNGETTRDEGISLEYAISPSGKNPNILYPNLTESGNRVWQNEAPETCEFQGYFYYGEDDIIEEELEDDIEGESIY